MLAESERSSTSATIPPGTVVAERYRVDSMLGEGGMGVVYLAEHIHIRKRVAIKVLLQAWTSTPEVVARFEQEAVAAGAISHPNVAAATDFGRLPDGSFYLVLEYLEGRTLRRELASGALEPARALAIARGIAMGIGAAHAKGIVHRDLKPENVMLVARDGDPDVVKVLDFGIARVEHRTAEGGKPLTSAGAVLGTPHYMAPEQALGNTVDARTDLYALGVMLFEMLTGECPFQGSAVTLLQQHLLMPAPALPPEVAERVPLEARALVARLLEKEPKARFASAAEVALVLHGCITGLGRTSGPRIVVPNGAAPSAARAATQRLDAPVSEGATRALGPWGRSRKMTLVAAELQKHWARFAAWLRPIAAHARARAVALWRERPKVVLIAGGVAAFLVAVVLTATVMSHGGTPAPPLAATTTRAPAASPPAVPAPEGEGSPSANDAILACLDAKFTDRIEGGQPAGDARGIAAARKAIYWIDFANRGRPTRVTLVWTIDGKEVQRQTLHVGHAPHWRTWGVRAVGDGHEIGVQVLDEAGNALKQDSVTLEG
jgi:serine/threonine-protein kinase